ncbi:helix-turn-helix domain-containing protein [Nocardiopsis alba]|uniref:Helix-turn-helix domain-containing protein n=1 Tax=Nocardiopsis alba TaxID=53437 RepID=A0A7K2IWK7_9ACTN|nr:MULTISPECIES: helix-turn-helix transcriptional regulator [Nocardiopsis]MEC3892267.1 helix-turn-helix transcriptional regulator [Nocardiopsis sp. LDBS1602]MYR34368.1 helix-turn-helix domain-containing protein [Nocardiopsis alba]
MSEETAVAQGSPVRRRHLVSQLKRLRSEARLSQGEVSKRMGWESGKIIRIETGKFIRLNSADVSELCRLYGSTDELREDLVEIAKASRTQKPWWFQYKDVGIGAFYGLEHEAAKIQQYTVGLVPGLLQHRDYIEAMMARGYVPDTEERTRRVEARIQRHSNVLERENPPRIWMILDESCLRCVIGGPEVMAVQLDHLIGLANRPFIDLQILPSSAGMSRTYGFSLLTFDESDRALFVDVPPNGLFFEDREDLLEHEIAFDQLQASALSTAETRTLLKTLINEYKRSS